MQILQTPFVFLSYATPDRDRVLPIYEFLSSQGIEVWMDIRRLMPGQSWKFELKRALNTAAVCVVFISRASVDRTGYVQRELKMVLDNLEDRPLHRIYAIPVILDAGMPIPDALKHLQCLTLSGTGGHEVLLEAIRNALGEHASTAHVARIDAEVEWSFEWFREAWDGLPGYDAEVSWPVFQSTRYSFVSHIGDAIRAKLQLMVAREREAKLDQMPDLFSFMQNRERRTNTLSVRSAEPMIKNEVLSQYVTVDSYGAGGAHGQEGFLSWVFVLDPLVQIEWLQSIFLDPDLALVRIQTEARHQLYAELERRDEGNGTGCKERIAQIAEGTETWDAFRTFGFTDSGILLLFAPYQVAAYAYGSLSVEIPYDIIGPMMRRSYMHALGLS